MEKGQVTVGSDSEMAPISSRYYYEDKDRHGNTRRYFRQRIPGSKKLRKVRLRENPDRAEFHEEFAAAVKGVPYVKKNAPAPRPQPKLIVANSLRGLIDQYYKKSLEFLGYDEETKKVRKRIFLLLCSQLVDEDDPASGEIGDLPYADILQDSIIVLINRKATSSIDSANAWLKALRKLFAWATSTTPKLMTRNVAKDVALIKRKKSEGWHTWTVEEALQYRERHPPGTKAFLALALFMLTGQRLSDVAKLGRPHIRRPEHISEQLREVHPGRWLAFRQHKNRNSSPVDLVIPILPQLEEVFALSADVLGELTFLQTEFGRPFTTKGLGNWFGDRCVEAKVPGRAHGVRKAGATWAAEQAATDHQLMAIFGWKTIQQAQVYTKKARQQMIAGGSMRLITFDQSMNKCDPPTLPVAKGGSTSG
jgi:integrase